MKVWKAAALVGAGAAFYGAGQLLAPPAWDGLRPRTDLTPGITLPVTAQQVCVPGYAQGVRSVSDATKAAIYAEYGIKTHAAGEYEVDHLISLELGGSNDPKNLWPQSYRTQPWNAHVKDGYEDWLHAQVCGGKMVLGDAQDHLAHDWIAHYQQDLKTTLPLPAHQANRLVQ